MTSNPTTVALEPIGSSILNGDGHPRVGSFRGIPASFDYSSLAEPFRRDPVSSFLRRKRWLYSFVATDEVIVVCAVADAGPTGTAFIMATDRATGEVLADISRPGATGPLVGIADEPAEEARLKYALPGISVSAHGVGGELVLRATCYQLPYLPLVSEPWLELDLRLGLDVHEGLTAVAELAGHDLVTATSKNAGLPTRGQLRIKRNGHHDECSLVDGIGGFDYTNGFLPRHTSWRWAFATGRLADGRTVGLNLVSGFTGLDDRALENGFWLDGALSPLDPRVRIVFDQHDPLKPWSVSTIDGAVDLRFEPLAVHREGLNLGIIRSRFIQPTGHFTGTVRVGDETVILDHVPGVVEDQDVLW